MPLVRWMRHLLAGRGSLTRRFPASLLGEIESAVRDGERRHCGEVRVAIEAGLPFPALVAGGEGRRRALELFGSLGVWDTADNNGVLVYVLLADRDVEIVADRGFLGKLTAADWQPACTLIEGHFAAGDFRAGILSGLDEVHALIARHYPAGPGPRGAGQPDAPVVL